MKAMVARLSALIGERGTAGLLAALACLMLAAAAALAAPGDAAVADALQRPRERQRLRQRGGGEPRRVEGVRDRAERGRSTGSATTPPSPTTPPPGRSCGRSATTAPANGVDEALALRVSPDGSKVFVTGQSSGIDERLRLRHRRLRRVHRGEAVGEALQRLPRTSATSPSAVAVSPDGAKVFVTGVSYGSTSGGDYATVAYDASTGAQLWVKRYNGPANGVRRGPCPRGEPRRVEGVRDRGQRRFDEHRRLRHRRLRRLHRGGAVGEALQRPRKRRRRRSRPRGEPGRIEGVRDRDAASGSTSGYDYATVAYNASTGAKAWVRRYNGPGNGPRRRPGAGG